VPDTGAVTQQLEQPAPVKPKRGRESVGDMIRSLSLVLGIVVVVFVLAKPPGSDEQAIRVVDPAGDVRSFAQTHPGVPVPTTAPAGWRATVTESRLDLLRVGWVTPAGTYVEYAATTAPAAEFVQEISGGAPDTGAIDVAGVRWQQYAQGATTSLVRTAAGATIVVGTRRGNASLSDLRLLAGSLAG